MFTQIGEESAVKLHLLFLNVNSYSGSWNIRLLKYVQSFKLIIAIFIQRDYMGLKERDCEIQQKYDFNVLPYFVETLNSEMHGFMNTFFVLGAFLIYNYMIHVLLSMIVDLYISDVYYCEYIKGKNFLSTAINM